MKMIRWTLVLLLYCCIFCLAGCSKKPPSEAEMQAQLQENTNFYPGDSLTINDLKITKHQTDEKEKTDTVYVMVDADNDDVKCTLSYVLTYVLYNEGWMLEDVERDYTGMWEIAPLKGPNLDIVQNCINKSDYADAKYVSDSLDLDNGTDAYIFTNIMNYPCMTATNTIQVIAYFDKDQGIWICNEDSPEVISTDKEWNLNGTWEFSWAVGMVDLKYTVTVMDFTDGILKCEYDLFSGGNFDYRAVDSGEFAIEFVSEKYDEKYYANCYPIIIPSDNIHWNFELQISRYGVAVDDHNLTRISE